jgi:hypothetical protein
MRPRRTGEAGRSRPIGARDDVGGRRDLTPAPPCPSSCLVLGHVLPVFPVQHHSRRRRVVKSGPSGAPSCTAPLEACSIILDHLLPCRTPPEPLRMPQTRRHARASSPSSPRRSPRPDATGARRAPLGLGRARRRSLEATGREPAASAASACASSASASRPRCRARDDRSARPRLRATLLDDAPPAGRRRRPDDERRPRAPPRRRHISGGALPPGGPHHAARVLGRDVTFTLETVKGVQIGLPRPDDPTLDTRHLVSSVVDTARSIVRRVRRGPGRRRHRRVAADARRPGRRGAWCRPS